MNGEAPQGIHGYLLPDAPEEQEAQAKPATPSQLVFKGLLKHMKPVQALIFMGIYTQFPGRFIPHNEYFFQPSMKLIIAPMRLKEPVYHMMMARLVEGGWLSRRKHKRSGQLEYRIEFDKLRGFLEGGKG